MGFHKRYLNYQVILTSSKTNGLKNLFTKCEALIFEDKESSYAYDLFSEGKSDNEIIQIINKQLKNTED
jgi:hypothetical protein